MLGGFASGNVIPKFRVINVQDSFEVENVSSLALHVIRHTRRGRRLLLLSALVNRWTNPTRMRKRGQKRVYPHLTRSRTFEDIPLYDGSVWGRAETNASLITFSWFPPISLCNSHDRRSRKVCNNSLGSGGTLNGVDSVGYDLVWCRGLKGLQVHRQFWFPQSAFMNSIQCQLRR